MSDWSEPPARHPAVIGEAVEDELVLLMPHAGAVIVLNEVGRAIWGLLDGRRDAAAIAAELCAEYEVGPEEARRDVAGFLADLRARGMLLAPPEPVV